MTNNSISKSEKLTQKAFKLYEENKRSSAIITAKKALKHNPKNAECLHFLGLLSHQDGNTPSAINYIKKAISISPSDDLYLYNYSIMLRDNGEFEAANEQLFKALKTQPQNASYLNEIAYNYIQLKKWQDASIYLSKAYDLDKNNPATLTNIAFLYREDNKIKESIDFAQNAIKANPNSSAAFMNLGQSFFAANQFSDGFQAIEQAQKLHEQFSVRDQQSFIMNMLYTNDFTSKEIYKQHLNLSKRHFEKKAKSKGKIANTSEILKVGFVSSDFKQHAVSRFLEPIFQHIDGEKFEVYCYSGVETLDDTSNTLKNMVSGWRDISGSTDTEIVDHIKNDKINILIDLSGHSKGNYLRIFGLRASPIQMTFIGYPFSTGLNSMDYRITDEYSDPTGKTEHIHSEQLIRLNPSFLCYSPEKNTLINNLIPFESNNFITFGSFNNFKKLSPTIINTWCKILAQVQNSQIILKNNLPISDLLKENILSLFKMNSIDIERVKLLPPLEANSDHLNLYNSIDIALDSFPYNGTTTTFEALWMGVPVITLCGDNHRSRVGNSILRNLDESMLIANTNSEYVDIAKRLASNIEQLRNYRQTLRDKLLNSILTDGKKYTQNFESLIINVNEIHSNPEALSLSAQT